MNQNHHNITPQTWQQTQDVTPQTALVYNVSAESHGSPAVLCLLVDLARKDHAVHSTPQSKTLPSTLSFSEHRCDNCNWAVLEDLLLKRNKPRKTNLIYRNRCMNETSFHKKPTATDQSWQGALITSLKYKSGNTLYGKDKQFSRWAFLVTCSTRKTSRVTNNMGDKIH